MSSEESKAKFRQNVIDVHRRKKFDAEPSWFAAPDLGKPERQIVQNFDDPRPLQPFVPDPDQERIDKLLKKRESPLKQYTIDVNHPTSPFVEELHSVRDARVAAAKKAHSEKMKRLAEAKKKQQEEKEDD